MTLLRTYEDLDAWQAAHEFTLAVYRATDGFPGGRLSALSPRRDAAPSPFRRTWPRIWQGVEERVAEILSISDGSLQEARYLLRLAADLGYYDSHSYELLRKKADRVGALLGGLTRHLNESIGATTRGQ